MKRGDLVRLDPVNYGVDMIGFVVGFDDNVIINDFTMILVNGLLLPAPVKFLEILNETG